MSFSRKFEKNWVQAIEKNGFWVVLTSRLVPVMPSSLINVAAGSSRITVKTFLFATFIGNGLYLMALFLLMEGFIAGGTEWFLLIGVVLLFCTIAVKKKMDKTNEKWSERTMIIRKLHQDEAVPYDLLLLADPNKKNC